MNLSVGTDAGFEDNCTMFVIHIHHADGIGLCKEMLLLNM